MIRCGLIILFAAALASGGIIATTVVCPGYSVVNTGMYAECYKGSYPAGPFEWWPNKISAEISVHGPIFPGVWPSMPTDHGELGPYIRVDDLGRQPSSSWAHATAELDWVFALTINLPQGGSGYYIPCIYGGGYGWFDYSFAGTTRSFASSDTCKPSFDAAFMRPFVSGVSQAVDLRFFAHTPYTGYGGRVEVALYSFMVFDDQMNRLSPFQPGGVVTARLQMVPEPSTLLTFAASALGLLAARVWRYKRRGVSLRGSLKEKLS